MALKVLGLCFLTATVSALPTTEDQGNQTETLSCSEVFSLAGLNYSSFWEGASHGSHSLSLEEIRYFFKPDAPENNRIPTVNIDFRSEEVIHFNAPLWGYEDRFETWALKIMDWFMLNDKPYLYETGTNALEKLTHQYHMHEIFKRAAIIYKDLVDNPPMDGVCACANDVTANGILKQMVNIGKQLKYRARKPRAKGRRIKCEVRKYRQYGDWCWDTERYRKKRDAADDEQVENLRKEYLSNSNEETAWNLLSKDPWVPGTFTGPDQWISSSAMLLYSLPSKQRITDFATFIFCKLNKPDDQPTDLF